MLGELALVPSFALQPFPGFQLADCFADALHDLRHTRGIGQLHAVELTQPPIGNMCVRVDEAWGRRAAMQIDDARLCTPERKYRGVGADSDDPSVSDRHGLCDRVPAVLGNDRAVRENEIRW